MRVSKTIRTYIEDRVNEKYADRIKAVSAKYHEELDEINEELRGLVAQANEQVKMFLEERHPGWTKANAENQLVSFYNVSNSKAYCEVRRAEEALRRERDDHVTKIIVNLELGGSRAELEEMLAKI